MRHRFLIIALLAASGSSAAALDRAPAAPDARLLPCPEHGIGFARVPGTATCLRVSGRVAAGADVGSGPRTGDAVSGRFAIDTRSETGFGPARAFLRLDSGRPLPR